MSTPDEQEQALSPTGDLAPSAVPDLPLEATDADVLEQAADAGTAPHSSAGTADRELPLEASEADALEQAQVVPFDEDDRPA